MSNILDKAKSYFETHKEIYGDYLYLEKDAASGDSPLLTQYTAQKLTSAVKEIVKPYTKTNIEDNITSPDLFTETPKWQEAKTLVEFNNEICNCLACPLGHTRKNFVFGVGNPDADIMVIGEAPGADEDDKGEPFVGRAGQLLTKILEAINFRREDVYICNIIKCRPPENRRPTAEEVNHCEPYLMKQVELIKPAFILSLGLTAVDTLLKTKNKMGEMRGKVLDYQGTKMLVTYHPAALLRNPNWKPLVWEDVKLLRRLYDEYKKNNITK